MKKFFSSPYRNYVFLIPLFLITVFYQVTYSVCSVLTLNRRTEIARAPLAFGSRANVTSVESNATQAGMHMGDRVLSIDSVPFTGEEIYFERLHAHKPGSRLSFTYVPKNTSAARRTSIVLRPIAGTPPTLGDWTLCLLLIAMPLLCVALGFYAAAIRPYDPRALFLLGLLIGVSQLAKLYQYDQFPRSLWVFADSFSSTANLTWALWMLLFALFFPERFEWERRRPWIIFSLAAASGAIDLALILLDTVPIVSYSAMGWATHYVQDASGYAYLLTSLTISGFFTALFTKLGTVTNPDSRRRLRIFLAGSLISLTPLFALVIVSAFERGNESFQIPEWISAVLCILFSIFPATLSYVIVVDRAMELRMVIRQGVRYVLARGGVRVALSAMAGILITGINFLSFGRKLSAPVRGLIEVAAVLVVIIGVRFARKRLLAWVDRRFFREAYNAEQFLEELSDSVRTIMDERLLLGTVTRRISESLHVPHVAVLLNGDGWYRPVFCVGLDMPISLALPEDASTIDYIRKAKDPPRVYLDDQANWANHTPETESTVLRALDSQLLLPVGLKDRLLGVLSLGPKRSEEPYSRSDVQLLRSVALQTGLALENSRLTTAIATEMSQRERLNREMEIAREVQERLFPQMLTAIPGIDYFGKCRPALGVGGDYYDFLALPNDNLGVAIGDVSGKGIAAALLMASLQASLRGQAILGEGNLARLMSNVNQLVFDATPSNRYATFFYGEYDKRTQSFTYVNAGHNPPLILRQTPLGETHVIRLETGGPVVGLFPHAPYQQATVPLLPGDIFVGFTDGISEAMNKADEEWGEERMIPSINEHLGENASQMIPHIIEAADRFVDGAPQHDDMTLVVVKMLRAAV